MTDRLDQIRTLSGDLERAIEDTLQRLKCPVDGDDDRSSQSCDIVIGERMYRLTSTTSKTLMRYETTVTCLIVVGELVVNLFFDDKDIRVAVNGHQILETLSMCDVEQELGDAVLEKLATFKGELEAYQPPAPRVVRQYPVTVGTCTVDDLRKLRTI